MILPHKEAVLEREGYSMALIDYSVCVIGPEGLCGAVRSYTTFRPGLPHKEAV